LQQACYASGGSSPYCALQIRPNGYTDTSAANAATAWLVTVINIAEIETYGADLEANYARELFGRRFTMRGLASYQPHIFYKQPALPTIDQGGVAFGTNGLVASPAWRLTAIVGTQVTQNFSVDVMARWRNALKLSGDPTQVWVNNHVASFGTANLNMTYNMDRSFGETQIFLNVQNVLDKNPPPAAFYGSGTIPGLFGGWSVGDDPVGRYYTLGARIKM
jgi:hypothetical protein